mgnify:CR=1 FL=1
MEQHYTDEKKTCKKCGEEHRVDAYRELKYYWCPLVNRILLVNNEKEQDSAEKPRFVEGY